MPPPTVLDRILTRLRKSEGFSEKAYVDTEGYLTIVYGLNLGFVGKDFPFKPVNGIPRHIGELLLTHYVMLAVEDLNKVAPWVKGLDPVRREVLYDMTYNMGVTRFNPSKWPTFFRQVEEGRYEDAAQNMRGTKWARQVKGRARLLADMMEDGVAR